MGHRMVRSVQIFFLISVVSSSSSRSQRSY
jgi:hypothetical protein